MIAQAQNQDQQPIYGSYMIGCTRYFTTLFGQDDCSSRLYDAAERDDLRQIIFVLRKLKELILHETQA